MKLLALPLLAGLVLSACTPPPAAHVPASAEPTPAASPTPPPTAFEPKDFSGTWVMADEHGQAFEVVIFPGGQAVSTWSKGSSGARGERGFWRTEGDRLLVFFHDGWTDEIRQAGGEYFHRGFEPGADLGGRWKNESPARRLDGDGFTGVWQLNKEPDGSHLYVSLQSSGRAISTIAGGTEGKWEATKDGALCSWPDGWNDLIYLAQDGYQKRSWVGPADQNSTPPDISPATRVGSTKFLMSP